VGTPAGDLIGVADLGVQRVSDEDQVFQAAQEAFDRVQQGCGSRYFAVFRGYGDLGQDDARGGVQCGPQMDLAAVDAAGTPQCLAVDCDDLLVSPSGCGRPGAGA
jgi:hypothetical protein